MPSLKLKTMHLVLVAFIAMLGLTVTVPVLAAEPASASQDDADTASGDEADFGVSGDWYGYRTKLHDKGVDFSASETLDFLAVVSGGVSRGTVVQGLFTPALDLDLQKLAGADGLTAHISALQIHGQGLSAFRLNNNIATSTGIEAEKATRLFELWAEQSLFNKQASIRIGQLAADSEFTISDYGLLFVNSAYGWPSSLATNLPGGGPGYPLASPGVRLKIGEDKPWSFKVAVMNGDPAGGPSTESTQSKNASGTMFPLGDDALIMSEAVYARQDESIALPGTYKLGFWYHTGNFADQRFGTDGLSLADSSSNGFAKTYHQNYGFYGVVDQMLWRPHGSKDQGVAGFARLFWNPDQRNVVGWQLDAGVNVIGMVPGRQEDVLGLAFTYLPISDRASGLDRDNNFLNAANTPVRSYESQIELTYQAKINPWFTLQPDFQYIFNPGGNVSDPKDSTGAKSVSDAAIIGLRAIVAF